MSENNYGESSATSEAEHRVFKTHNSDEEDQDNLDRKRALEHEPTSDDDQESGEAGRFKRQATNTSPVKASTSPAVEEALEPDDEPVEEQTSTAKEESQDDSRTASEHPQSPKSPRENGGNSSKVLTMRALISSKEAGIIIGKSGKNVDDIRQMSGAKVTVSEQVASAVERVITITGALDTIAKAFSLVATKIVEEQQTTVDIKSRHTAIRILVPHARMGSIIGKGGSKIKEIQDASGAKVIASEDQLPGSTERTVTVAGVIDSIHIATYYIGVVLQDHAERAIGNIPYRPLAQSAARMMTPPYGYGYVPRVSNVIQMQQIFIPNDMVGAIIGKQGAKINEIRSQSNCQIKIAEPSVGINERLVTITGTPENNQVAMYLLYSRLEAEKNRYFHRNE